MLASENCTKIIVVIILLYLYFRTGLSNKREREEFFGEEFIYLNSILCSLKQYSSTCTPGSAGVLSRRIGVRSRLQWRNIRYSEMLNRYKFEENNFDGH
jgi:hypothetical protein